mmetsp:Transcript_17324/g.47834  ORF Transcript_17324/g.47834 Transcript_17324/m.47834 type:complete len:265 (-) Transcript_17324:888-1682(-)
MGQRTVRALLAHAALEELAGHPRALFAPPGLRRHHLLDGLCAIRVCPACSGCLLRGIGGLLADLLDGGYVAVHLPPTAVGRLVGRDGGRGPDGALRGLLRGVCHLPSLGSVRGVGRVGCRLLGVLCGLLCHLRKRVQGVGCPAGLLRGCHGDGHRVPQLLGHVGCARRILARRGVRPEHRADARRDLVRVLLRCKPSRLATAATRRRTAGLQFHELVRRHDPELALQIFHPAPQARWQVAHQRHARHHRHGASPESRHSRQLTP